MGSVFNLVEQYNLLMQEIEELGGEITPEIAEQLNIKEEELANKVRAYYYVIKTAEGQIQLAKDEQERLMNVRKSKEGLIKRLKKTVDLAVETFGTIKPKAVGKSLDLGDLKVWQKKTVALDITGDIDDDRFCNKQLTISVSYDKYNKIIDRLVALLVEFSIDVPITTIVPNKDILKEWLIENEEYIKEQRSIMEENVRAINDIEKLEFNIDQKLALYTQLNHNSTVVFK